jgi:hypothetical protein
VVNVGNNAEIAQLVHGTLDERLNKKALRDWMGGVQ